MIKTAPPASLVVRIAVLSATGTIAKCQPAAWMPLVPSTAVSATAPPGGCRQRASDIAVLKALGATTASLVRDALGQALVVLTVGIGVGLVAVVGFGTLAGRALPFVLSPLTTLAPAAVMAVLGLAGAGFALRTVTHADPLTALGSNR